MIPVRRNRQDEKGRPIQPDQDWFERAKEKTQAARVEGKAHEVDRDLYAHQEVRMALEKLFHHKCAYCEFDQERMEVEHFRPKGGVSESPTHPGYYWLAYCWDNLYPSCPFCNQRRIDYPSWDDARRGPTAGKGTQFPLADEATRAQTPDDNLELEARLLIDPCQDDPAPHFTVNPFTGDLIGLDEKGRTSISVFNLNRKRVSQRRQQKLREVQRLLNLPETLERGLALQHFVSDDAPFAGACRALVRDPRL